MLPWWSRASNDVGMGVAGRLMLARESLEINPRIMLTIDPLYNVAMRIAGGWDESLGVGGQMMLPWELEGGQIMLTLELLGVGGQMMLARESLGSGLIMLTIDRLFCELRGSTVPVRGIMLTSNSIPIIYSNAF